MAPKKKQETINELDNAGNSTAALDTLQPNSRPVDDPKTKFQVIANVIGALAQIDTADLNKFGASLAQIGQEATTIPDGAAAHNASTIAMKPSDASASVKEAIRADVETLLASGEGLSEEFKTQAATLFEAALNAQVQLKEIELQEQFDKELDEAITEVTQALAEEVDTYISYTAAEWLKENEVAVESALRNEIYDDFIQGLKSLFEEHYITIPEEKVDVVETLAEKVDELENRLNEMLSENAELQKVVAAYTRDEAINKVCEGLTMNEAEKLKELADGIEETDSEAFTKKLEIIKESNFVKGKSGAKVLAETMEEVDPNNAPPAEKEYGSPEMKKYAEAISRTVRK